MYIFIKKKYGDEFFTEIDTKKRMKELGISDNVVPQKAKKACKLKHNKFVQRQLTQLSFFMNAQYRK